MDWSTALGEPFADSLLSTLFGDGFIAILGALRTGWIIWAVSLVLLEEDAGRFFWLFGRLFAPLSLWGNCSKRPYDD